MLVAMVYNRLASIGACGLCLGEEFLIVRRGVRSLPVSSMAIAGALTVLTAAAPRLLPIALSLCIGSLLGSLSQFANGAQDPSSRQQDQQHGEEEEEGNKSEERFKHSLSVL